MKAIILSITFCICLASVFHVSGQIKIPVKPRIIPEKNQQKQVKKTQEEEFEDERIDMDDLDEEELEMMKRLGIKLPDMDMVMEGMKQDNSYRFADKTIPDRDQQRIEIAGKNHISNANLPEYIRKINQSVSQKAGKEALSDASQMYALAKADGGLRHVAQLSNGLWLYGANTPALLVLGMALSEYPGDDDNINNYSAFLTMAGAEEAALPLLNYLNRKYPQNSTILNNLGQAWFGLGEFQKAYTYLDSATIYYPGHSQANFTKSVLEEYNGDKSKASQSMIESWETSFSNEKNVRLRDLDLDQNKQARLKSIPKLQSPFQFPNISVPEYPKSVEESIKLEPLWKQFRADAKPVLEKIVLKHEEALKELQNPEMRKPFNTFYMRLPAQSMIYSSKAQALKWSSGSNENMALKRYNEQITIVLDNLHQKLWNIEEKFNKELTVEMNSPDCRAGEGGTQAQFAACCAKTTTIYDRFLRETNTLLEEFNKSLFENYKIGITQELDYQYYTTLPHEYEAQKLHAQMMLLTMLAEQDVRFTEPPAVCNLKPLAQPTKKGELPDFDDVSCNNYSTINLAIGTITTGCNRMITTLDAKYVKFTMKENMNTGEFIRGTLEFGVSASPGNPFPFGPVKAEMKVSAGGFIELDKDGITDIGVKAGVKVNVGTNIIPKEVSDAMGIGDQSVTAYGAEARWGWNSGGSLNGKGLLSGLKL